MLYKNSVRGYAEFIEKGHQVQSLIDNKRKPSYTTISIKLKHVAPSNDPNRNYICVSSKKNHLPIPNQKLIYHI